MSKSVQDGSRGGDTKVLVVNDGAWESLLHGHDALVGEIVVLLAPHSWESVTHVEVVFQQLLVVCSDIKDTGNDSTWVEATAQGH